MKAKWEQLGIDAVIMPNHPIPAFKGENAAQLGAFRDYQLIWSVLHYAAGTVPVTVVKEEETHYEDGINDAWTRVIQQDMATAHGMPVGVQVVSRMWEDEVALGVMKSIEEGLATPFAQQ